MKFRIPSSMTATGRREIQRPSAAAAIVAGSRRSASTSRWRPRAAGQQRLGCGQHQRVVVDVDDPGLRRRAAGRPRGCCSRSAGRCRCPGTGGSRHRIPGTEPPGPGRPGRRGRADDVRMSREHPVAGHRGRRGGFPSPRASSSRSCPVRDCRVERCRVDVAGRVRCQGVTSPSSHVPGRLGLSPRMSPEAPGLNVYRPVGGPCACPACLRLICGGARAMTAR